MPKKRFRVYRLYFNTPLHIGDIRPDDYGNSESFIRSDTLLAAITAMLGQCGKIDQAFDGNFNFQISSLFPFTTIEDTVIYFFPKLSIPLPLKTKPGELISFAKKLKKLQWLDFDYFEAQLNQREFEVFGDKDQKDLQGKFCSSKKLPDFITPQIAQRVTIPRDRSNGEDPTPFYMERLFFQSGSGLFFLAEGKDFGLLEDGLELLQYEGLGTDRTIGNGGFKFEKEDEELELEIPSSTYCTNLSLFCPEDSAQLEKMLHENATYDTIKRGGWITTEGAQTLRKKAVYMFTEGSIFSGDASPKGRKVINLSPDAAFIEKKLPHSIYRCGHSIFLPVKL
ncbi:MAG: type III-A CRISPR-associated RAMP protein Csm4 [Saprospiraceae bacterium]